MPEHVAVTGILGGLELVPDALPGQLQPLKTVELIHLKRGQARLWFRVAFRSFRLLRFDGLALPTTSHAGRLYARAGKQNCCRLQRDLRNCCEIGLRGLRFQGVCCKTQLTSERQRFPQAIFLFSGQHIKNYDALAKSPDGQGGGVACVGGAGQVNHAVWPKVATRFLSGTSSL
jgi:hypothetical protein